MDNPRAQDSLAARLAAVQQQLSAAGHFPSATAKKPVAPASGRRSVTLIGASKTQPAETVEAAIELGLIDFGENRVQEALGKWPGLKIDHPQVRLHLIGPLQSNKAADAVGLFDVIHTLDRVRIAETLAKEIVAQGRCPRLLVQVNIGEEPQKGGVAPSGLPVLLERCRALGLMIDGLMCVPPVGHNPAPYFALMKKLADRHGLTELSMGMSDDFPTAIRFGATMVRVGTALFGARG